MTAPQPNVLAGSVTQTTVPRQTNGHRAAAEIEPRADEFLAGQRLASLASLPGVVVYQRVVTPDEKIRYTYISEGARDIFGVSPAEIFRIPRRCSVATAMNTRQGSERLPRPSKALTTWDVEASIVTRDGRKKYTHAIARPERQPDGSVLWTGIILDETRTREAVVEGLSQGFLLYGADDRLILRNSHFLDLYRRSRMLPSRAPGRRGGARGGRLRRQ